MLYLEYWSLKATNIFIYWAGSVYSVLFFQTVIPSHQTYGTILQDFSGFQDRFIKPILGFLLPKMYAI